MLISLFFDSGQIMSQFPHFFAVHVAVVKLHIYPNGHVGDGVSS